LAQVCAGCLLVTQAVVVLPSLAGQATCSGAPGALEVLGRAARVREARLGLVASSELAAPWEAMRVVAEVIQPAVLVPAVRPCREGQREPVG